MTLLQLQYFQALAYILHYTKTAETLHISQPSLSYSISELEKEIGVDLFIRKSKNIQLTDAGKSFLPYVEKALDLLRNGEENVRQKYLNKPDIVKLGYFYSISADFIPSLIAKIRNNVDLQNATFSFAQDLTYNIEKSLETGDLDIGFTLRKNSKIENLPIFKQRLFLVVSRDHPLTKKRNIISRDFVNEPIIVIDKASQLRTAVEDIYNKINSIPNIAFEVKECSTALQFVARKLGIAILPLVPAVEAIPVKYIPIQDDSYFRQVYFSWVKGKKLSASAEAVKNYIIDNYINLNE